MPSIDEILASSPLAGLLRVSHSGGDREVALVRLAENFTDLDSAPAASLVVLSRSASTQVSDYRLDMALRWAAIHRVAAVAAFADGQWQPTITARDIAGRADIALVTIAPDTELAELMQAVIREIGGGAERALGRAAQGLDAVLRAEAAGADLDGLREAVSQALGTPVEFRPLPVAVAGPGPEVNGGWAAGGGSPAEAGSAAGARQPAEGGLPASGGQSAGIAVPAGAGLTAGAGVPAGAGALARAGAPAGAGLPGGTGLPGGAGLAAGAGNGPGAEGSRAGADGGRAVDDPYGGRGPGGAANGDGNGAAGTEVSAPIVVGETPIGHFVAPDARGDFAVAVRLVLHTAALAAARLLDLARRAREVPVRSRSELLAELLMSEAAINEDLLERARQLAIPIAGWHVAVRIEADDLDESGRDEVHRFELLESAGQVALQAVAAAGGTWYLSRIARAIVLVRMTTSNPGPQAGARAARSAERALGAITSRLPALRWRAGVGAPHEGPMGLRASAAEAKGALLAARAALKPAGVAAHDAVGVRRMLMEWYSSDTARASVRDQLAPLEKLGAARADTAIRTLAAYLDEQGSIIKTAQKLHLHRNAVANRLRGITELLEMDLDDPDQRLALQLACRARLLD